MNFRTEIKGHELRYTDEGHQYTVDGYPVPSITQILKIRFGGMYKNVKPEVLKRKQEYGTAVHETIERYCLYGEESDLKELRNFKFLMDRNKIKVERNEVPVILFADEIPVSAGRLDLVLSDGGMLGIADIKTTSVLNKEYLAYQLNLYRIAFEQCYGEKIQFLRGVHLIGDKRKYVDIPINEEFAWGIVEEYINE